MKGLYLDCKTQQYQLLLANNSKIIDRFIFEVANNSENRLLEEINRLLHKNNLNLNKIDVLVVNRGPGSFTGVRIGIAVANAFKLARPELKLVGVFGDQNDQQILVEMFKGETGSKFLTPLYDRDPNITKSSTVKS